MASTRHDKELDALLNRLHSGCRFIDFDAGKAGGDDASRDVCNRLRNASPPDETHADLGRELAHSYIGSLRSISTSSSSKEDGNFQPAIDRAERILQSLCRGSDATKGSGRQSGIQLNYASTACAFFGRVRSSFIGHESEDDLLRTFVWKQWQHWCVRCEELVVKADGVPSEGGGGGIHVLNEYLKGYGHICHLGYQFGNVDTVSVVNSGITRVYESLAHHSSRKYFIRTCVVNAFTATKSNSDRFGNDYVDNLSPLFHLCVLRARSGTIQTRQHAERQLILREILKACSTKLYHAAAIDAESNEKKVIIFSQIANMIQYLTSSLTSYLTQIIHATFSKNGDEEIDVFELGYEWLGGICDLVKCLLAAEINGDATNAVTTSIEKIIAAILPQFTTSLTASFDMAPIYTSLVSCINLVPQINLLNIANSTVTLRLGSIALNLQDDSEITLIIELILSLLRCLDDTSDISSSRVFIGGIATALGCIFRFRPACFDSATQLYELGESLLGRVERQEDAHERKEEFSGMYLMEVITCSMDREDFPALMKIITASVSVIGSPSVSINRWQSRPLLLSDQCAGLLLGLSLLHMSIKFPRTSMQTGDALAFLRSLLQGYPRLASRAIPSIIDAARTCLYSQSSMTEILLGALEFLSTPCVVLDPHGAQMAWAFLSSLAKEGVTTAVRSTVLRLLPGMCSSNKRLTRRVLDVIGFSMVAHDPIIRLSATAALSDLAKFDLIRDLEPIIGLVQNRLIDDDPAVLYYALEALRYFVVSEELEFDLVVRVLEKRLDIDLSNTDRVLGLEKLALEGLVGLLGEGGLEEEEEEDDDDKSGRVVGGPAASPRSIKAVTLLVELALMSQLSFKIGIDQDFDDAFHAKVRIQNRIYCSLAKYSAEVLGLDSESIRLWDSVHLLPEDSNDVSPEIRRYVCLKNIVLSGLDFGAKFNSIEQDVLSSATTIGKTLLLFEEDVHGSFLFRGSHSSGRGSSEKLCTGNAERQSRVSKSVLSSLPDTSRIHDIYNEENRSAAAIAVLYSIGANATESLETEDILMQISGCIGDVLNEPFDSFYQAMQVCAIIHSMDILWKSIHCVNDSIKEELLNQVVSKMEEWVGFYGEYAYVFMAAFVLAVDDTAHCWAGTMNVQKTILEGQNNYLFESDDTKYLCLGIVAARLSRNSDARVTGVIDSFEQFLWDNGRQTSFGALFGLGIINANLMTANMNGTDPSITWRKQQAQRIMCTLLSTFNTCLTQQSEVVLSLASAMKSGREAKDLFQLCSDSDSLLIQDGFAQKMRACLIGLGSSFPVLSSVSTDLLKCVLVVVDKLPWGSGKGFVLHVAYRTAVDSGVLEQKDLSEAILTASIIVKKSSSGVGDALLSLASLCRISSDKAQRVIDVVADKCQEILQGKNANVAGDDRLLATIAGCAAIGEVPGLALFTPNIQATAKKNFVATFVKILEDIASTDVEEPKYRDAATIGLGVLCAMSNSGSRAHKKVSGNKLESIHAKDGSLMQVILQEVEQAYTTLCLVPSPEHTDRFAASKKLCAMFSALEAIALPGGFSRVIEQILNVSSNSEVDLKASAIKLLVSQLESRRRIGFDGRGFIDLSTRLATSNDLKLRIGPATSILMTSLSDLIYQISTSIGEEVVTNLWTICRDDLKSFSTESMVEFLGGMKKILVCDGDAKSTSKKSISPALHRTLQKFIEVDAFFNLCKDAVPPNLNGPCTKIVWTTYLSCLQLIPTTIAETDILNGNTSQANVFGMAIRSALSPKATRKVEYWISLQGITDVSIPNLRIILLSAITVATHVRSDKEMKESILALFEVMLVKGIDTMSLYLLAAKVAFWWDSREVYQLESVDIPAHRVFDMSSFYVNGNLNFDAIDLTPKLLFGLFDAFVTGLPIKLAMLCGLWKMSDDVSNRASRILSASLGEKGRGNLKLHRKDRALSCLRDIIQTINGGEI